MRGLCKASLLFFFALKLERCSSFYMWGDNQHTQGLGVFWQFCLRGCWYDGVRMEKKRCAGDPRMARTVYLQVPVQA